MVIVRVCTLYVCVCVCVYVCMYAVYIFSSFFLQSNIETFYYWSRKESRFSRYKAWRFENSKFEILIKFSLFFSLEYYGAHMETRIKHIFFSFFFFFFFKVPLQGNFHPLLLTLNSIMVRDNADISSSIFFLFFFIFFLFFYFGKKMYQASFTRGYPYSSVISIGISRWFVAALTLDRDLKIYSSKFPISSRRWFRRFSLHLKNLIFRGFFIIIIFQEIDDKNR